MNKENFIETTTRFNELKKEFDNNFYVCSQQCWNIGPKIVVLKNTMDKLLSTLDELIRE